MFREAKLSEIEQNGLLHSQIEKFIFDYNKKTLTLNVNFIRLKNDDGSFYNCTITITDWWDLEVIEKGKNVYKKYGFDEIPKDIEQIFKYEYDENEFTLIACGYLDIDSTIYYKFIKPKIQIIGEYDPD